MSRFVCFVPKADIRIAAKQHRYSITSSARASSVGGTSRPRALAVLRLIARCNDYTKIEPTLGGSDDENSHCSNCGRDLGNCDRRRADHCAGALRRLRDRRPGIPNRAPRLCVLPRVLGTAARGELLLVPHPADDAHGNMVGWRGRTVAFCSWLAGYRPWPLP